jgi:hypothetical protein
VKYVDISIFTMRTCYSLINATIPSIAIKARAAPRKGCRRAINLPEPASEEAGYTENILELRPQILLPLVSVFNDFI